MDNDQAYTRVTANDNSEYFCPLEIARDPESLNSDGILECVEADVLGRYSGHLPVETRDGA